MSETIPRRDETVSDDTPEAVLAAYAAGFDDFDTEAIAACFHFPVTLWQQGEAHVFETEDDLIDNIEALLQVFETEEIVRSEVIVRQSLIAADTAFLAADWRQERADGEAALEFSCRYTLVRRDGDVWRIALTVTD